MRWSVYKSEEIVVEEICYDEAHIKKVLGAIQENFVRAFEEFVDFNASKNFTATVHKAITDFEHDRDNYKEIFNMEALEEYEDDPNNFKSDVLKNKCPIIRKTLNSKLTELKQYKSSFRRADANELLEKITNICAFGRDCFEDAKKLDEIEILDTEPYSVYGVIGGGIKTHLLYKLYPALFPNRSQDSLWALYFLSGQEDFDCEYDSEFLMIEDTEDFVTRQNYFYPCELFYRYATEILKLLEREAIKINQPFDKAYSYVVVDAFLSSVAENRREDIKTFTRQIANGGFDYA